MHNANFFSRLVILMLTSICILLLATLSAPKVQAKLPPIPDTTSRPTQTLAPSTPPPATPRIPVAMLVLNLSLISDRDLLSVVQWQDRSGSWHDVEGWRGSIVNGHTFWWVEEKDWGHGPFRWYIYASVSEDMVAISEPFNLPSKVGERTIVTVQISQPVP